MLFFCFAIFIIEIIVIYSAVYAKFKELFKCLLFFFLDGAVLAEAEVTINVA